MTIRTSQYIPMIHNRSDETVNHSSHPQYSGSDDGVPVGLMTASSRNWIGELTQSITRWVHINPCLEYLDLCYNGKIGVAMLSLSARLKFCVT
jgi:hypothetical protein